MAGKIIVTGSAGQLGSELKDISTNYPAFDFLFFDREGFPLDDEERAETLFEEHRPSCLINAAAYTAVDKAESEPELASAINGTAVGGLAFLCKKYDARFVHISTDYVFNGMGTAPLKEGDETDPVNAYGASKLLGEFHAQKNNPDSLIIRTSWVYSSYGKNFVKTMIRLMNEKESISVVDDQQGSPTYAADLAEAIMRILTSDKWVPGIYNFSNEGVITWYRFALAIKELAAADCIVNPVATSQFPTPAKRPAYSVLDKTKIAGTFGIEIKDWESSLRTCLRKMDLLTDRS